MSFLSGLFGRQKKVTNQKLADDISNLCEELTSGIIELSVKANKINELKEKYKKSQSELEDSSTNPENEVDKPVEDEGFLSSIFGSNNAKASTDTPNTTQPQQDMGSQAASDYIDPESLSAASENPINNSVSSDFSQGSDAFSSPPPDVTNPNPEASSILPPKPDAAALPPPSFDPNQSPPVQQVGQIQQEQPTKDNNVEKYDELSNIGGKNRKKSKRSKQTIRKTYKKMNRVTKKQKNITTTTTTDNKANTQGLAQALLQAQGQA